MNGRHVRGLALAPYRTRLTGRLILLKGARRTHCRAPAICPDGISTSHELVSDYDGDCLTPGLPDETRLSRPARLPHLLRSVRRRPVAGVRAWTWGQSSELVAAGAALPRPLHLRDLRASRLCAVERAGGRSRPRRL